MDWQDCSYYLKVTDDGVYLANQFGWIATPEEVDEITKLLRSTAHAHGDDIRTNNHMVDYQHEHPSRSSSTQEPQKPIERYVYMFKCGGKYKIGVTNDVERRIKQLDNRPYPVKVFATSKSAFSRALEVEADLHLMHESKRINGEWFELTDKEAELTALIVESADDSYGTGD